MSAGPGFAQQVIQAGYGLGFGGPNDPRRRIARPDWTGSSGATPAMATPQPAGVGGEAVANPAPPRKNLVEDITDPSSSLYGQRHGGSFVTGLVDGVVNGVSGSLDYMDKVRRGELDPRSQEGIEGAFDLASNVTLGAGAVPAEKGALRAGASVFHGVMDPAQMTEEMKAVARKYTDMPNPRGDVTQTTAHYRDRGELEPVRTFNPEALQGSTIIGAPGDRTWAGHDLTHINGEKLGYDVPLIGGEGYMRDKNNGHGWASARQAIDPQVKGAQEVLERGGRPVLAFSEMGPRSGNYSTMTADTLLSQIAGRETNPVIRSKFDDAMRKKYPEFAGLADIYGTRQQLMAPGGGNMRTDFVKGMDKAAFQGPDGLPNVAAARWATNAPDLRLATEGKAGYSMAEVDGVKGASDHPAYPLSIGGKYLGGLPDGGIPRELMFHDAYKARRDAGIPTGGDRRFFELKAPYLRQEANQEWLDRVMQYYEGRQ